MNPVTMHRPIDHGALVRRRPAEVVRFRRILRASATGELSVNQLSILHDEPVGRGWCCRREAWFDTFRALFPADGPRTLWIAAPQ